MIGYGLSMNRLGYSDENFQEYAEFPSSSFSISGNYTSIQKFTPSYLKEEVRVTSSYVTKINDI